MICPECSGVGLDHPASKVHRDSAGGFVPCPVCKGQKQVLQFICCDRCFGSGVAAFGLPCNKCECYGWLCRKCHQPSPLCICSPATQPVEVRCCCDPRRLLGFYPVRRWNPAGTPQRSVVLRRRFIRDLYPVFQLIELPVERFSVELPLSPMIQSPRLRALHYWAIKSNETPIEHLRQCEGFEEA